ncbi:hypothetical protein WCE37_03390 [Luteimonas sp. MJ250]|uniref:hypothetical protein n=1 Tax=Luteimonas sp. MJ250 TaxID=3129236 RepID=UPI0031BB7C8C
MAEEARGAAIEPMVLAFASKRREPQLTDDELRRVRAMLASVDTVHSTCPMARGLLGKD